MADNTPNFDAMTPEEIMAWMESLAKRQGAAEGFTTAADVEIPEIDPDSVVIDEPGYVPSEGKDRGKRIGPVIPSKPAATTSPPPPAPEPIAAKPAQPEPEPEPIAAEQTSIFDDLEAEPELGEIPDWLSDMKPTEPEPVAAPVASTPAPPPPPAAPAPEPELGGLSWLESLAVDAGASTGMPELDLSSLASEITGTPAPSSEPVANPIDWLESLAQTPPELEPEPEPALADPVDWLETLAQGQGSETVAAPEPAASGENPINWLESLAKRQGAREEELTTTADAELPSASSASSSAPGYSEYTYDTPGIAKPPAPVESTPQDPAAWLDSLATQAFESNQPRSAAFTPSEPEASNQMSDDEIQQALKRGEIVPHDQMEAWMQRQLQEGARRPEPEELAGDYDPDAPPIKAELPDWLIEQVGAPTSFEEPDEANPFIPIPQTPALIEDIVEPPAVADMPDWLRDDEPPADELDSIFATPQQENWNETVGFTQSSAVAKAPVDLDPNDPWVEALEMEYAQSHGEQPPTPAAPVAPPAAQVLPVDASLQDAALPAETQLPAGQIEPVPAWLTDSEPVEAALTETVFSEPDLVADMPDWLKDDFEDSQPVTPISGDVPDWLADVEIEPDEIPDWLKQSITSTSDQPAIVISEPPPPAAITAPPAPPPPAAIAPVRASPAPVPVSAQNIDVGTTLSTARSFAAANNVEGSLASYESLIRANAALDDVTDDLAKMADKIKTSAPINRVLGDALMRQGKLQAALDTYRKALNQL